MCDALSKSSSSFRKPSVVSCEEGSTNTLIMTDTNNGRLKMITTYACIILKTFLENLRKLLSAFNGQQMMLVVLMTLALTQAYLHRSFFMSKQWCSSGEGIHPSDLKSGTLSSTRPNRNTQATLTFAAPDSRAGNTATPTMLDFRLGFVVCKRELRKL